MEVKRHGALTMIFKHGRLYSAISYSTCLYAVDIEGNGIFNSTKYTTTTSKHQGIVRGELSYDSYISVDDVPQDADDVDLLRRAAKKAFDDLS